MKKLSPKLRNLLERPVEVSMLPPLIPRGVGAAFALLSIRTLARYENKPNGLTPIRRGTQNVYYERGEFLRWLGIEPPEPAPTPTPIEKPRARSRRRNQGPCQRCRRAAASERMRDLRGFVARLLNVRGDEVHGTRALLRSSNAGVFTAAGASA